MIPKITYQEIIDKVKTYAKTNCKNIANFNSIPAQYKAGFAFTVGTRNANFIGEGGYLAINNPVVSVNASTVDTDMDTFLNNLGLSGALLEYPIDDLNFNNFLLDMLIFLSTRTCFAVSRPNNGASSDRILVYDTSNAFDYSQTKPIKPSPEGSEQTYTYNSSDLQDILNKLITNLMKSIRVVPLTFTFTCY